jgi:hypothetical protein
MKKQRKPIIARTNNPPPTPIPALVAVESSPDGSGVELIFEGIAVGLDVE